MKYPATKETSGPMSPRPDVIADIPTPQAEEIYKHVVSGSLWFISVAVTAWVGYKYGLRSQDHAAKLSARNAALSVIDRISADLWDNRSMWPDESKSKTELSRLTFEFSSQFRESDRVRIKKALDDYKKQQIRFWEWPPKDTPERAEFMKQYQAMMDSLKRLRDEISDT